MRQGGRTKALRKEQQSPLRVVVITVVRNSNAHSALRSAQTFPHGSTGGGLLCTTLYGSMEATVCAG